jgi:hypothetical protein
MPENSLQLFLFTAVLVMFHLLSPLAHRASRIADAQVASFTGGLAAAYVFLHLFSELDKAHVFIGDRIYLLVLIGFIVFYGMENNISHAHESGAEISRRSLMLRLGFASVYNVLLVFTLGEQMPESAILSGMFAVTLGLHLMAGDVGMMKRFGKNYRSWSRYTLAGALILGLVLSIVLDPGDLAIDVLTASLAGFIIFNVFHEEISPTRETRFRWFLLGALGFAVLHLVIGS